MAQRIYLGIMAVLFVASAAFAYLNPQGMGAWLGIASLEESGHTEIRAVYGGLVLGNGLLLAAGIWSRNLALAALLATVFGLGCLALTRLIVAALFGAPGIEPNQGIVIAFELAAVIPAAYFARRALREDRNLSADRY
ncbi:DUF4345 family protein [Candidatus Foliamicus sp.]